ncbi:hypothetical protein L3X38_030844 [Prunus dulcis]|uniref:Uncharacterized protein n=1 Tax=Prunus dulcis TaxID=3755 RepID=A0AAD4YV29_PRUDU|nr:hypothetical protein L3X38_030844 [Prunus dulcis]
MSSSGRFVQKFFCFSRFMFLVVWPWFLIRSDLNCISRSYTPSFSWSSPSSSFPSSVSSSPSSSLPSSPSSVWRCSSSSRSPQRSPQRSDVDNPINNLHGRRGRTPISGRGHQTIPLHHRTSSYSPPRRSRMYSNHRRHYSRSPSYSSDLSRRRSPVRHRYLADSPYDSREYSPDDSYHVRRYRHGRRSPSPLGARRRSRRSYSHSVSPRPRRSYRRNYPRLSPEPKRRTVRESYSPSSSRIHRSLRSYRRSPG